MRRRLAGLQAQEEADQAVRQIVTQELGGVIEEYGKALLQLHFKKQPPLLLPLEAASVRPTLLSSFESC